MSGGARRAASLQLDGREVATLWAMSDNFPWVLGTFELRAYFVSPH